MSRGRIILQLAAVAVTAAISAGCGRSPAGPAAAKPPSKAAEIAGPFTRLFDGGNFKGNPVLSDRVNWSLVPEDVTAHTFTNVAVVLNDKLALAIHLGGAGAEICSRTGEDLKARALLAPFGDDWITELAGLRIVENSSAAVALEGTFKSRSGKTAAITYRLTTGANMVEVRPGQGMTSLRIVTEIKHVIVPDYFADDVVVSAESSTQSRVGLPAENSVVNLLGDGDAILACVWPYGPVDADAVMEKASFSGVEIACMPGKSLWVALLEKPGIWHSRAIGAAESGEIELTWKRPFAAQWRCDTVASDGLARSAGLADGPGPQDRAFVRPDATVPAGERLVLVYPIDRTPATPLTAFCVNDVMRSALGTGPCQYVLQAEGMGTEYPATPDLVSRWLDEEFRKGKLKQDSAAVRERLDQMARHVETVQGRIRDYGKLADLIQSACAEPGPSEASRPLAQEVAALLKELRSAVAEDEGAHDSAAQVSREIPALAEKEGAADVWQAEMGKVRAVGGVQDRSLARCRMTLRRIIVSCRGTPAASELADRIRKLSESGLRKEAATHEEKKNGAE